MKHPQLGLRGGAQQVQLVLENGQTRPVIGTRQPTEDEAAAEQARVRVALHWGARASPRRVSEGGITEPQALRSRTILSHRLPSAAQRLLQEGLTETHQVLPSGVVTVK
ncbi:hypothetical protein [Rhodoferax sp.]|uniref:hypothetical protein n=1 Tax=Rhodoferax sp. TaxID=50421 RepID=UPI002761334B|nr:hypothetical protein [Rhodoferax sp.]